MRYSTFIRSANVQKDRLTKIHDIVNAYQIEVKPNEAQTTKLNLLLKESRIKFSTFEKNLLKVFDEEESEDYKEEEVLRIQNEISDLCINIEMQIKLLLPGISSENVGLGLNDGVNRPAQPQTSSVKLPKINLKTFNGDSQNWISYINLFDTTIHSSTILSSVEKHQYLISSLTGEALDLVKALPISDGNYLIAYNTLRDRYHSTRRLISLHINKIIDLPNISDSSVKNLRHFLNNFNENEQALLALDCKIMDNNPLLTTLIFRKMNSSLRKHFESKRGSITDMPQVKDVIKFLNEECIHNEDASLSIDVGQSSCTSMKNLNLSQYRTNKSIRPKFVESTRSNPVALVSSEQSQCFCCNDSSHNIYGCPVFMNKTPQDRYKVVHLLKRCVNCLGNHTVKLCNSKQSCKRCFKSHHTLLHFSKGIGLNNLDNKKPISNKYVGLGDEQDIKSSVPSSETSTKFDDSNKPKSSESKTSLVCEHQTVAYCNNISTVLLATTLVNVVVPDGRSAVLRGLIDSASQCSFISESAAQLLRVPRSKFVHSIDGISSASTKSKGLAYLNLETLSGTSIAEGHPVLILDKITSPQPRVKVHPDVTQLVKKYILADPTFNLSGPIDILIGCELFAKIFTGENYSLGPDLPNVLGTVFGYVIMGRVPCIDRPNPSSLGNNLTTLLSTNDLELHNSLQRFWHLEEPPQCTKLTEDDIFCEEHFVQTHTRNNIGRYVVRLPMKPNHPELGDSLSMAKSRMTSLENKFKTQPHFKRQYFDFMNDYHEAGHMVKCDNLLFNSVLKNLPHFFLPHHGVIKESSSTTRLRVVFDASAKSSNQVSLNDILLPGPKLQTNVCDILLHFRKYKFVFSCDIRQMYRQIELHPEDQNFQLILWRENPTDNLSTFKLSTVTYGMNSSPFLAIRTLKQLAHDEGKDFPDATQILLNHTYMDDICAGHDTESQALDLQNQLVQLLGRGCFELRKWISNSPKLLQNIPEEHQEVPLFTTPHNDDHFRILGMYWCASTDTFSYNFSFMDNLRASSTPTTKRHVLSIIAQIFDPVGFLSPIIMKAKCFMQLLWTEKLLWDEPLPQHLATDWTKFIEEFHSLADIKISRSLGITKNCTVQLHGFCDACIRGYACVVFIRTVNKAGQVIVKQLISKTRLAPLKIISLPRLELCGGHLLSKLMHYCIDIFSRHCDIESFYNWCDSTIVLTWIHTPPYRLKTFIANRVADIQKLTPSNSWHHVKGTDNPADCASRGLSPLELKHHHLWWKGPDWLRNEPSEWPRPENRDVIDENILELTNKPLAVLITSVQSWDLLRKYSCWIKLQNVLTFVLRFIHNCRHRPTERNIGLITLKELKNTQTVIFKLVQNEHFSEDVTRLKTNKPCSNQLQRLSPFLDDQDLIRVGGRLRNSVLKYQAKHPIVLPKSHPVVSILVDFYHITNLHAGPQLTQAVIFQRFWILSARSLIRSRIYKCLRCFRCKPRNTPPLMGDLPDPRVNVSRPFSVAGMDFCGPFLAKGHTLRSARSFKIYICVFICFSTKAVHIEIVSDLSTDAFLAALSRFSSRRGLPHRLYSDCGSNFLGADTKLKAIVKSFFNDQNNQKKISEFTNLQSVEFHFNPPAAPHQGGLWERAIKSIKFHLIRVVGQNVLTIEEFFTIATKVEAILNSRPLAPMSSDPSDINVLTPGHFLIGSPLVALPEEDSTEKPVNHLKRWHRIQAFTQHIWQRWRTEYLHTLQQRSKWLAEKCNVKVGDLVLVHDPRSPPLCWPLGRVISTSPGKDNIVRVVQIQTKSGILTRPVVKVFPLPNSD